MTDYKLPEPDTHCLDEDTGLDCWSYSAELMQQAYAAGRAAALEDAAKKVEEVHEFYGVSPAETIRGMK